MFFKGEIKKRENLFPKHLIIRKPAMGDNSEKPVWQGFVADIKAQIRASYVEIGK